MGDIIFHQFLLPSSFDNGTKCLDLEALDLLTLNFAIAAISILIFIILIVVFRSPFSNDSKSS